MIIKELKMTRYNFYYVYLIHIPMSTSDVISEQNQLVFKHLLCKVFHSDTKTKCLMLNESFSSEEEVNS